MDPAACGLLGVFPAAFGETDYPVMTSHLEMCCSHPAPACAFLCLFVLKETVDS
jgi:hypothetical protein